MRNKQQPKRGRRRTIRKKTKLRLEVDSTGCIVEIHSKWFIGAMCGIVVAVVGFIAKQLVH